MLSTSSRSRHSLSILYIFSFSQTRFSHPSLLSALCVCSCFFFRASIFPSKSLAGAPRASPLTIPWSFSLFGSHARRTCPRLSEIGRADVVNKNRILLYAANASSTNRTAVQSRFLSSLSFACTPSGTLHCRNTHEQSLREHLQRPALDVRPHEGIPRDVFA